ncbi:hypothetical protein HYC85_006817 [Camellia sinensis]|uniref:Cytochrome P450 n=1 Tax=Camellia sinensis TaxID=4442 RepID=A0A7J7HP33_CAMSI|nr:hypothetical protein HYC85_006817 [Camellia sinensis]
MVVLTATAATELFKNHDHSFSGRTVSVVFQSHDYHKGSVGLAPCSPYWRLLHRVGSVEMLIAKRINATVGVRRKSVDNLLMWIEREARGHRDAAVRGVHVAHFVFLTSFNILGNLTFSETTFLNGDLDEEIHMDQPEGFVEPDQESKKPITRVKGHVSIITKIDSAQELSGRQARSGGQPSTNGDVVDPESAKASELFSAMTSFIEWAGYPNLVDSLPWLGWVDPQGLRRRMDRDLGKALAMASGLVKKRVKEREEGGLGKWQDFLDVLLDFEGNGKDEPEKLSEAEINIFIVSISRSCMDPLF